MNKKLVIVTWDDAHGSDDQLTEHEIPHAPWVVQSVGWLLRQDDAGVTIAAEYLDGGTWRGITFIPKGMVREVKAPATPARRRQARATPPPEPAPTPESCTQP